MKKISYPSLIFILSVFLISCFDQQSNILPSPHKAEIKEFLDLINQNNTDENRNKINALLNNINFTNVAEKSLKFGRDILIVDLASSRDKNNIVSKLIFFKANGKIEKAQTATLTNSDQVSSPIELIARLFNNEGHTWTGKLEMKNVYDNLIFYSVFDHGKLKKNGAVTNISKSSTNKSGKTNGCTDWYLVTNYYSGGSYIGSSEVYVGTTCDCENNMTRMGRIEDCGGGGGGGSNNGAGGLPGNPAPGQTYSVTNPLGVYTVLQYNCYDYACLWEPIYYTIPDIVVEGYRDIYYWLPTDPSTGDSYLGIDGLMYTYSGGMAEWNTSQQTTNLVCGSYIFGPYEEGWTTEIWRIGATIHNWSTDEYLHARYPRLCVTFGYNTIVTSSAVGTTVFNQGWTQTIYDMNVWLNSLPSLPTQSDYQTFIFSRLQSNLNFYSGGSVILSTNGCSQQSPGQPAKYCE